MSTADPHAKGNYIIGVKKSIIGSKVRNGARQELGKIEDVVIDSRTTQLAYAILSFGGLLGVGSKHFAIPWEVIDYHVDEQCAFLNIDKSSLENSPGFDAEQWPDMTNAEWANSVRRVFEQNLQRKA